MGLPGPILRAAMVVFAVSFAGALGCLGVFFWYDTDFWEVFEVGGVAKVATVSLSGLTISSALLFFHYNHQESYMTFEAIVFLVCFAISLVNLLWMLPLMLFA